MPLDGEMGVFVDWSDILCRSNVASLPAITGSGLFEVKGDATQKGLVFAKL